MDTNYNLIAKLLTEKPFIINNDGLFYGKMGLSIFLYHASRETKNEFYEQIADDMLDTLFGNIYSLSQTDFASGLAGIGWGIEYLVQNGFAEGDTDVILEDIDREVFKKITQEDINTFDLHKGLTGYLYYVIWRLRNKNNNESMEVQINRELLILLINKIDELVTPTFSTIVEDIEFDLFWSFPVLFFALYEAYKLEVYNVKIERIIIQWLTNVEVYMPFMNINRIYMATTLSLILKVVPEKRLEKHIKLLLYSIDFEVLRTEVDKTNLSISSGRIGFVWLLERAYEIIPSDCPNYSMIIKVAKEIKEDNSEVLWDSLKNLKPDNQKLGLVNGITGIGLLELMFPEKKDI